jgi:hypothetical protein
MSEARYSSSDIPNFDTYPSTTPLPNAPRGVPEIARRSDLEIRAARIGAALGQFVLLLRDQKEVAAQKLSVVTEDATAVLNQKADVVKARAEEAGQIASNKAQELWAEAERRAVAVRELAVLNLRRAQLRAQEIERDYPERVAIGIGTLGLAVGVGLRIWRASRA